MAVGRVMTVNPENSKIVSCTADQAKDPINYFGGPKNSGSQQQQIFSNNPTQRLRWPDQANDSTTGLAGT
jgi:hypothetical protein